MRKNRIALFLITFSVVIGVVFISSGVFTADKQDNNLSNSNKNNYSELVTIEKGEVKMNNEGNIVSAHYSNKDKYNSLEELKKSSDLIIVGKVESTEQNSEVVIMSKVNVLSTKKGKKHDKVNIYQMGTMANENILEEGKEYILFLTKHQNEELNSYYIKGAEIQGKFIREGDYVINNDSVMSNEIKEKFSSSSSKISTLEQVDSQNDLKAHVLFKDFENWLNQ